MLELLDMLESKAPIQASDRVRINVAPWINIAPGKFEKKNKRSPIYTLYLYYYNRLYGVQNKAVGPGKNQKINK